MSPRADEPGGALRESLMSAVPEMRRERLISHVRAHGAATLGLGSAEAFDPIKSWSELGIDPERLSKLCAELARELQLDLAQVAWCDHPNVLRLAEHLARCLVSVQEDPAEPSLPPHPLLGSRIESSVLGKAETLFQSRLSPNSETWLRDYVERGGLRLSPGLLAEVALAAEAGLGVSTPIVLRRPVFFAARAVEQRPVVTELLRRILADGSPHSSIRVRDDDGEFRSRFECSRADAPAHRCSRVDLAAAASRCPQEWAASQIVAHCAAQRAGLPQSLQWIEGARCGAQDAVLSVALPPTLAATAGSYVLHPALLDACIQAVRIILPVAWSYAPPISAEEIAVCRRGASRCRLHVHLKASGGASIPADLKLCDDDGEILATACSLVFAAARGH